MKSALFSRFLLPALLASASLAPQTGQAGEITTAPSAHFDCAATLTGTIQPGDLERIQSLDMRAFANGDRPLCLDSPGGSFGESLRIADFLHDRGIPTAVDDGAECLNACALVLLGGSRLTRDAGPVPNKRMHLNANVAFGGLHLPIAQQTYTPDQVAEVYGAAMQAASAFTARLDTLDIPTDLAAQILALTSNEQLAVDRVDEARALGLQLEGFEAPSSLSDTMVTRSCIQSNRDFDPDHTSPGRSVYDHRVLREQGATAHRKATYIVEAIIDGVPSWLGCQVELNTSPPAEGQTAAALRLRTSPEWTSGGNPTLFQVHKALLPQDWTGVPFRDFWKLIPENQTLAEARKMTAPDASSSIIVSPVRNLPATTLGTEAALGLLFDDRQEIQNRLTLLGFDTRGADGIFGPGTRDAMREWQRSNGLEPTGFLDRTQLDMLNRQSASLYGVFAEEQRREEEEQERLRNAPAPVFNPPASADAPAPEPEGQRVRVCQRTIFGELVNCRIEFR
ncbi:MULTISPECIES: peptidoglycan-binding protein [unclassified Mameliella]|uniref:peptidoglycan-binding protein n=1 Tax=unclassified Mameliella TaxID=2630630 RepID=UPI00273D447D|nr:MULTISPECIES: peptidoglycan-binding protein [unclassified Mameliella]